MLFILDRSFNVIDNLSITGDISKMTPFFDDLLIEDLASGAETYKFEIQANLPQASSVTVGNYIAFRQEKDFKLFTIIETDESHSQDNIKSVYCEMTSIELINNELRPNKYINVTAYTFLESILANTDWQLGIRDIGLSEIKDIDITDYTSVYEAIQEHVVKGFGAEIRYRVEIQCNTIVGKFIDIFIKRGKVSNILFSYTKNMTSVSRKTNLSNLVTALIGVGKNNITFRDIETSTKPAGQDFIVSEEAYRRWNRKGKHIIGTEKFDTESEHELLKLTAKKLEERANPQVKYELKVELLGDKVAVGDTVRVVDHDFNPPLYLEARVSQLKTSKTDPTKDEVVLSNFKEIGTNITEEMKNIASKLEGYVDSQFPIGGDKIQDGAINGDKLTNGQIIQGTHIFANSITADHIQAETIDTEHLKADSIDAEKIQANSITSNHIQSNTIETEHLKANIIQSEHIQSNTIDANHIISNSINSGHIQTGSITAGSGIIADGAIGNAQISSIDAGKIEAGTIDTSKVTIQGANGHLRLKGNRMQVFQGVGNQAKERVSVGDVNGDGTVYGLRVRGADGQTILLDENGVKSEGITDGAITNDKISEDANIDGAKLNINSVINRINTDGTEVIQGTKIEVDGTNLGVKLSEITNKQTSDGERITQAQAQITANQNAIKLKVDEQTYTTDKNAMTSKLEKNTSEISTMKGQIALKVEQTDIENAKNELTGMVDNKISSAKSEIKTTTDGISQKVGKLETTTTTLSGKVDTANTNAINAKNTANTANNNANQALTQITTTNNKLASIESNVNGITSRVSNVENKQTTVDGKVSSLESRMSTAESKITETAITNTVKKNFYTKNDIDSKGYQNESQVQQTVNGLQIKVSQSGGYNLIKNSTGASQNTRGWTCTSGATLGVGYIDDIGSNNSYVMYLDNGTATSERFAFSSRFKLKPNTKYTFVGYFNNYNTCPSFDVYVLSSTSLADTDTSTIYNNIHHLINSQNTNGSWKKFTATFTTPASTRSGYIRIDNNGYNSAGTGQNRVHWNALLLVEGELELPWSPHPSEVYDGITTIDNEGITVRQSNISTYTTMDASSFRVENNTGGTVAEFSQNSQIPNLTAGIITANEIYAGNVCSKSPKAGGIKFIYVNGATGNDNNAGTQSSPYKTVQRAIDDIKDKQDQSVTIYVYNSVPGFDLKGITGTGVITFSLQDSAVINGFVVLGGVTNTIRITNESGSLKPTFKNGISIFRCVNIDIFGVTFRGVNAQGTNIYIQDTNYCAVNSCDLGGLSTRLLCAIRVDSSLLWLYGCRGSNITDVVGQYPFSHVMMARAGTSNVPDYSNTLLCNYDGGARIQNWTGGTFTKTPSSGWNPAYTPTQKTQTWSFNKIWSDETLHGWSDRQELIQGYASTWNTGRWTGYMQFTDGMAAIRSAISGGTNLSGRLYVQRRTSSGNSTGSKLCLYASDGTLITNSTTINRGQGVWVTLSSAIISKIASGAITYFYLKADANNTSTFFKCEANAKIEITYTK